LKRGDQRLNKGASAHAERRLRSDRGRDDLAAQHYRAIIESSEDAILSKDLDGVILSWTTSRLSGSARTAALSTFR